LLSTDKSELDFGWFGCLEDAPKERRIMSIATFITFFMKMLTNPALASALARFLAQALKTLM
jgi:hypothetical protein